MPGPARSVLAVGLIFLLLGLLNAALATTVSPELQRAEVLNGLAAVALMLVAALWTRADPKTAERVSLPGEQGLVLSDDLTEPQRQELAWKSDAADGNSCLNAACALEWVCDSEARTSGLG